MKQLLAAFKNPLFWVMLAVVWLLVLSAFAWQAQRQQQQAVERYHQSHQQQIDQQADVIASAIDDWQKHLDTVVNDLPQTDANTVADRSTQWPQAQALCVIPGIPEHPLDNNCWPLGYASLVSIRQALEQQQPAAFLLDAQSDSPVVILSRVIREAGQPVSSVVAVLDARPLYQMMAEDLQSKGWLAIAQGLKNKQTVFWQGSKNPQLETVFAADVPGTAWQLRYQPAALPPQPKISLWAIPTLFLISLLLAWFSNRMTTRMQKLRKSHPQTAFHTRLEITEPKPAETEIEHSIAERPKQKTLADDIDPAIFKTYDIRGVVGTQLNEHVVHILGQAIGSEALKQQQFKLVVGRDGRLSSPSLSKALIRGLNEAGCEVIDIGEVPTPLLYFACHEFGTGSGVMVTGSHNPIDYNGLKIVIDNETLSGRAIQALYQRINEADLVSGEAGHIDRDVTADYVAAVGRDITLARPLKVVVDCGNGIAGKVVPTLLKTLDCEVISLFCEVDGSFPNHHPNPGDPANLEELIRTVKQNQADVGLAFDGDGDRLGVVDGAGNIIWPDQLLLLFAVDLLKRHPGSKIIFDVKSSRLLAEQIEKAGGAPVMSASGHSIIKAMLKKNQAKLAGEMSGHICFADRWYGFDDALYAACRLLELLAADSERSPSEILAAIPKWPSTPELLVPMQESASREFMHRFVAQARFENARLTTIDGLRIDFAEGWGLVRQSNTVPGLTLRFEAETEVDLLNVRARISEQMLKIDPSLDLNW